MVLAAGSRMGRMAIIRGAVDCSCSVSHVSLVVCRRGGGSPDLDVDSRTAQVCQHSVGWSRPVGDYSEMACVYRGGNLFFDKGQLSVCCRLRSLAGNYPGPDVANTHYENRCHTNSPHEQAWL